MSGYYFSYEVSQDRTNTLVVYDVSSGPLSSTPRVVKVVTGKAATQYKIRKLTPRECGRLMGVADSDIDKMAAVNSNSQLYKQFGNSIVVDVMVAMFKNLNINQKGGGKDGKSALGGQNGCQL